MSVSNLRLEVDDCEPCIMIHVFGTEGLILQCHHQCSRIAHIPHCVHCAVLHRALLHRTLLHRASLSLLYRASLSCLLKRIARWSSLLQCSRIRFVCVSRASCVTSELGPLAEEKPCRDLPMKNTLLLLGTSQYRKIGSQGEIGSFSSGGPEEVQVSYELSG